MSPDDPKLMALRVVIDQALEAAISDTLTLAEEKGIELESVGHILSASMLYHSLRILLGLANGDVQLAVRTHMSGLDELVRHISTPVGRPN